MQGLVVRNAYSRKGNVIRPQVKSQTFKSSTVVETTSPDGEEDETNPENPHLASRKKSGLAAGGRPTLDHAVADPFSAEGDVVNPGDKALAFDGLIVVPAE